MKLSTKGDYATRVLLELASAEGPRRSPSTSSPATGISQKYLEQIMVRCAGARWCGASAGPTAATRSRGRRTS